MLGVNSVKRYCVYIIEGKEGYLYTGITSNLIKRLKEHSAGEVRLTKNKRPLTLRYKENFETRRLAAKREHQIKGLSRIKKEKLLKQNNKSLRRGA